jgi:quinolinate synthase
MDDNDAALVEKIKKLKIKRNAVILAHNFQTGEVQDIADFVGDSLEVSLKAADSDVGVIVMCGVDFMAQTAAVLCPDKTILLPDLNAACPLASMITAERLREKKAKYPGAPVVCYIKAPAEVIAESDICCTVSNAVGIIEKMGGYENIIFVPDQYLGDLVCTRTGRDMVLWQGYCPSHYKIGGEDIINQKKEHPHARVAVHSECTPQVRVLADVVTNTAGIVKYVHETAVEEFIIGTETGLLHRLRKENPDKIFMPALERVICGKMKVITLESVLWSLENMTHPVKIPDDIRSKAKKAIDRMLEAG